MRGRSVFAWVLVFVVSTVLLSAPVTAARITASSRVMGDASSQVPVADLFGLDRVGFEPGVSPPLSGDLLSRDRFESLSLLLAT